jgi:putative membrane protein insertion efficiency factor
MVNKILVILLNMLIRCYQLFISPFLGTNCRFYPTCSSYSYEALLKHGILKGLWLTAYRIVRCHPFSSNIYDPVPDKKQIKS